MQHGSSLLVSKSFEGNSSQFLETLAKEYGADKKKKWRNNNSTLEERAYIINLRDLSKSPSEIISRIFAYNRQSGGLPVVAVPVAGWKTKKVDLLSALPFFSEEARKERLLREYAQSFSLSAITTAKNASLILRASKESQKMEIFKVEEQHFFRVSAGVRITDADEFLFKHGLALPPHMPTLHVASLVGAAANGCYGPGRDYGPMTTSIVEMKVINAQGERLTLSAKENADLFAVLRDCHMGTCFVSEVTFKVEPSFRMKRHHILFKDADAFKTGMLRENKIQKEHFIAMYIPVDIEDKGAHCPRIRVTTFERTEDPPSENKTGEERGFCDYLNLIATEAGEPLIDLITESEHLRKFFPFILKTAALKTYGNDEESVEVDWSAPIAHLLRTYTDLPITDINWLIQVESADDARNLLIDLLEATEKRLQHYSAKDKYPLLNAFSRYLKGVHYPEGEGGIAPTAVDQKHQSILSFEFVTYSPLAKTKAFKNLVNTVIQHLNSKGLKYNYHPGKHLPETIRSLTQIFTDATGKKRLKNFKKAVYTLHGGKDKIPFSPFLTPQKKEFIGFGAPGEETDDSPAARTVTKEQENKALQKIIELAQEVDNEAVAAKARELMSSK